jgi:4-hydroxybutyryl-CoA dehydratase/vinylacetyl-CoA-Delta-isomerase
MNAPFDLERSAVRPDTSRLMRSDDYRESLRRLRPVVYVDGRRVECVADEPAFGPGIRALGVSYDYANDPRPARRCRACCTSTSRRAIC